MRPAWWEKCIWAEPGNSGDFNIDPTGDLTGGTGHQLQEKPDGYPGSIMQWRIQNTGELAFPESVLQEQVVAQETVSWIRDFRSAHPEQPWFVCSSFSRPHFPLTAPKRWIDFYTKRGVPPPKIPAAGDSYNHPMCREMRRSFEVEGLGPEDTERMRIGYFACVSFLDEIIGDLLTRLEATGELDNTVIVYASDHGEMAGEHGTWWKHSFHEASVRVPLIVSTPGQRRGTEPAQVRRTPVQLIDLYPTFCGFAGAEIPGSLDARDLCAALREGREPDPLPVVSDNLVPRWGEHSEFRAVRLGAFKYVGFRDGSELFFNLEADPGELRDLSKVDLEAAPADILERCRAFVKATMDFEAVQQERVAFSRELAEHYSLNGRKTQNNLYHFKDGRIVNGEDVVYNPIVVARDPSELFGQDWVEKNQQNQKPLGSPGA